MFVAERTNFGNIRFLSSPHLSYKSKSLLFHKYNFDDSEDMFWSQDCVESDASLLLTYLIQTNLFVDFKCLFAPLDIEFQY